MKLRNKKTGEIGELAGVRRLTVYEPDMPVCGNSILGVYDTLEGLCAEWEDYKPIDPLIKDEKIRKAVREWAGFNGTYPIYREDRCTLSYNHSPRIEFKDIVFADLDDRAYTIDELCGEEEK